MCYLQLFLFKSYDAGKYLNSTLFFFMSHSEGSAILCGCFTTRLLSFLIKGFL